MNTLILAGHLGADPEVRFTSSGQKVTTLRLATKTRKGSSGEDTIWWRVTVWGEQFDKMISYLKKGSSVVVVGEMSKPEMFTDKNGNTQISMSMTASQIQFSPFGRGGSQNNQGGSRDESFQENPHAGVSVGEMQNFSSDQSSSMDDEIPF